MSKQRGHEPVFDIIPCVSFPSCTFSSSSSSIGTMKRSRSRQRDRISAEFSPIPAVNTIASMRSGRATKQPAMCLARLYTNISTANIACSSLSARSSNVLMSLSPSLVMPFNPERLFKSSSTMSTSLSRLWIAKLTTAGSMSPQRLPIMSPGNGEKPIVVSRDSLLPTAVTEAPLPRWQMSMLYAGLWCKDCNASVAFLITYRTLVPWKPYFRIPTSRYSFGRGYVEA
mmetsp:Transcript_27440/g.49651  ORF Transcript_27440/g.49651 Transcript_27440/m.49651 type:complete len:228 (-) Transcript_27440:133-816(-)